MADVKTGEAGSPLVKIDFSETLPIDNESKNLIQRITDVMSVMAKRYNADIEGKATSVGDDGNKRLVLEFTVKGIHSERITKNIKDFFAEDAMVNKYVTPYVKPSQHDISRTSIHIDVTKLKALKHSALKDMAKRADEFESPEPVNVSGQKSHLKIEIPETVLQSYLSEVDKNKGDERKKSSVALRKSIADIGEIISVMAKRYNTLIDGKASIVEYDGNKKLAVEFIVKDAIREEEIAKTIKDFFKDDSLSKGYWNPVMNLTQQGEHSASFHVDIEKFPKLENSELVNMTKRAQDFNPSKFTDNIKIDRAKVSGLSGFIIPGF